MAALLASVWGHLGGWGKPGLVVRPGGRVCQVGVPQGWPPMAEHQSLFQNTRGARTLLFSLR